MEASTDILCTIESEFIEWFKRKGKQDNSRFASCLKSKLKCYYYHKPRYFDKRYFQNRHCDLEIGQAKSRHENVSKGGEEEVIGGFPLISSQNESSNSTT